MKVLLTSCTLNSSLLVLRTLVGNGHEVIAVDDRLLPFGMHSRYVDRYEQVPHWRDPKYYDVIFDLIIKHRPDVVLPISGAEVFSNKLHKFQDLTNILLPNFESFISLNNKKNILMQCRKFSIPHSELIEDIDVAEERLSNNDIEAVVIKPSHNYGGGTGIQIVSDARRVRDIFSNVKEVFGECFMCEYVPGPDKNNYSLQMIFDHDSKPVCQFAFQKLRISPLRTGVTAVAVSKKVPNFVRSVLPMLQQLNWKGPLDFDLKLDSKDSQLKVIELNARFSGAVGFSIASGIDFPELTCQAALGKKIFYT